MAASATGHCLIVGASRGIGLGIAREQLKRGWSVIATARDGSKAPGLDDLRKEFGDRIRIESVDINLPDQIAALRKRLDGERFDLLLVNAGITLRPSSNAVSNVAVEDFVRVVVTNAYSPICFADAFAALVKRDGMLAFMSSQLGSVANNAGGNFETYRASKAALNTLTRSLFARRKSEIMSMLTLHPGHVKTDMTAMNAAIDVETSAHGLCEVIAGARGKAEHRYVDYRGQTVPW